MAMQIAHTGHLRQTQFATPGLDTATSEGIACAMAPSLEMEGLDGRPAANSALGHFAAPLSPLESALRLFSLGNQQVQDQQPVEAIATYELAIGLAPGLAEIHFNRANALALLQHYGQALAGYDDALALRGGYAQAHSNRGNTLYALGHYGQAIASFDQAIALQPGMAEAYLNRGNALTRLRQFAQAFQNYEQAIACKPDLAEAIFNKGLALQIMLMEQGPT
jgi:tetratricopeptide (TPR) repeat protein